MTSKEDTNFTYDLTPQNLSEMAMAISLATHKSYAEIQSYIDEVGANSALKTTVRTRIQSGGQADLADVDVKFGRRVGWYAVVRAIKPKVVIETGLDKGLGAVLLCEALLKNTVDGHPGRYFGTDINPRAGYLLAGEHVTVGEILLGDSIASLQAFSEPIDLFINDSDHSLAYEFREYQTIREKLSPNAIVLGDNSPCSDALLRFSIQEGRRFLIFREVPLRHWYPGSGIGISFR